ncbi:MAG: aconitate hydratase AcnA [Candidatus Eremiobacter antarcticus]|nr:aconitate hydratase AcnA [Candidatus Eremiobacteraeota bacterium]MBC5807905.1 aconitate hydratase AcnA [Candidatus Eremiobacteraeota bacterium]PZR62726.1 MAG: aconitate hydratase AcnA [Candidatus Eremiobacter sp. RRmetagenome_bin22]
MMDSFGTQATLQAGSQEYGYRSLTALEAAGIGHPSKLPFSLKVLLENLLRCEDGRSVTAAHIQALANWDPARPVRTEISFRPARVLLQDFTGVPAVVDLAAMRDAMAALGGDPGRINPLQDVELVIDHSVQVDAWGSRAAFQINADKEFERNQERYALLKWAQSALHRFTVLPPDTGIVHQVNLEYLGRVVFEEKFGNGILAYPDTLVGTDSHTTMINGLGVLGWGVGGIEAEAAMLGQPLSMLVPEVVGFRLTGKLPEGATATDLVLTVTQMLRRHGVVGKFVEFFGTGLSNLSVADRATIGNMSPEYGSTCAIFPIDEASLEYLRLTGRDERQLRLVRAYAEAQGLFRTDFSHDPAFNSVVELDLTTVEPCIAGPKRPQDRVPLRTAKDAVVATAQAAGRAASSGGSDGGSGSVATLTETQTGVRDGSIVIAAITSCTNTSNPAVLVAAGLLAKKAVERGLKPPPWVKTSFAPGSKVVTDYLQKAGLTTYLEQLGFFLVGYGCTTCIGNSGPLDPAIAQDISQHALSVCAVLSGNRNFEGRIHALVRNNYLASPPLVVAYALAGRMDIDMLNEPLGEDFERRPVFLRDLWPSSQDVSRVVAESVAESMFRLQYAHAFAGDERWQSLQVPNAERFAWQSDSTYVRRPPFFEGVRQQPEAPKDINGARVLALLGDSVTTDHISPAGAIALNSPAGAYLVEHGVAHADFNSYGARRGNHEVMMRGTFANVRLRNLMAPGTEGGVTRHLPDGVPGSIFDVAMRYREENVPLIIIAGKEYGSGSSRDWAAKGPLLLGVRAVIAESFERIHRSNLVGMGILPLQFAGEDSAAALGLSGEEIYDILGVELGLTPGMFLTVRAHRLNGGTVSLKVLVRIDTPDEVEYYRHGGILNYVLRSLSSATEAGAQ